MFQWYQRSIQDAEINAKNSEKENMTIRSNQFVLHESYVDFNASMKTFVFL